MLEQDLSAYRCPQQFIQFKLGLRKAASLQQSISFTINRQQSIDDIQRFLQKYCYCYTLDKQKGVLLVEPLRV
jgi:TusA-related sulfurtransferase